MKIDRLLGIIIYLLNHEKTTASFLAEYFNVSVRTIQRDIVTISSVGIPIYSYGGKKGGYSILPSYKIKNMNISNNEQQIIIKALESLETSYSTELVKTLLEKYNAIIDKKEENNVFWDFSITKENNQVQNYNTLLEECIADKKIVYIRYRNAKGNVSNQCIEPLAIHYKWYAWYLLAYSFTKEEYRTYKIARIGELNISKQISSLKHPDIKELMKKLEMEYYETCISIEINFSKDEISLIKEYFPDTFIGKIENTDDMYRTFINVPAKERLWKALLLSFGDKVKIINPKNYLDELIDTAKKFLLNYDI